MTRAAEITAIILCACFPILSDFVALVRERFSHLPSSLPSPIKPVRKSRIFKIGSAQSSLGIGSGDPQEVDMAWLNRPYQHSRDDERGESVSSAPSPIVPVRKSRLFRVGSARVSSCGVSGGDPQDVDMAWLKSPYQQLREDGDKRGGEENVVRDLGSRKTVGIRMASRDQLNAKSRVASMV